MAQQLFAGYAPLIDGLPDRSPLTKQDLLRDEFLLVHEGELALYWAPFEYINTAARVALVGITPGWYQTEMAFRVARDELRVGTPPDLASQQARVSASFSGPIRRTLVAMLDGLELNTALGIETCWSLWGEQQDMLHTTALVRYPLFVDGQNYTGYKPNPLKHSLLRPYITDVLADELRHAPDALVVPLGRIAAQGLALLVEQGKLDQARLLPGLPHPSGANAHRPAQYAAVCAEATVAVRAWFA